MRIAKLLVLVLLAAGCGAEALNLDAPCTLTCTGQHEVCVRTVEGPVCGCAAGYEGDPCEWGTVPDDPGFTSLDAWSDEAPGVEILPSERGLDPGRALLDETAVCNGGMVSQVVDMPGSGVGDQFVVEMTYRSDSLPPIGSGVDVYAGNALRTVPLAGRGDVGVLDPDGTRWFPVSFCLGEAAYGSVGATHGGPVEFRIGAAERDSECDVNPTGRIEVDRFQIRVANSGECPSPGSAVNGSAEPDGGGWSFDLADVNPAKGVATAALEPGVGKDQSGGARLSQDGGGNIAGMGTRISVPLPTPTRRSPALRFWWRADGISVFAELGPRPAANFPVTYLGILEGDGGTSTYCLPPWTHGSVQELWFLPLGAGNAGDFVVDDIELIDQESCGTSDALLDPGFDSAPNRWPGALWGGIGEGVDEPVQIVPGRGRSGLPGDGAAVLKYATSDAFISFHHWVLVPTANGQEGPQLTFYSNLSPILPGEQGVQVAGIVSRNSVFRAEDFLAAGVGWAPNGYCLPRGWAGRWLRFRVEVRNRTQSSQPTQIFDPPKEVLLDDFELTTSSGCTD